MRKPTEFATHPASYAEAAALGCVRAFCKYVTDGDTFDFFMDLGFNQYGYDTIRLHEFDTAEIFHPRNAAELKHGQEAKERVVKLIFGYHVLLRTFKDTETFGRYVADVMFQMPNTADQNWLELAQVLDQEGFRKRATY